LFTAIGTFEVQGDYRVYPSQLHRRYWCNLHKSNNLIYNSTDWISTRACQKPQCCALWATNALDTRVGTTFTFKRS